VLLALLADDAEINARLAQLPHRPGGERVSAVLDVGGGFLASETAAPTNKAGNVTLYSWIAGWGYDRGLSIRVLNDVELGAGNTGFQGTLGGSITGGYRFGRTNGPFFRAGMLTHIAGTHDAFYRSILEIPEAHVGWQWLEGKSYLVEAGWHGGLILTGRNDVQPGSRNLDVTFATGALAALHAGPLLFISEWKHIFPHAGTPIDWFDGLACGAIAHRFLWCARGMVDLADVHVVQVGWLIGMEQDLRKLGLY